MTSLDLERRFEGCKLVAYQDIAGVWTIGYGHTGRDVYAGLIWTQVQAETELIHDDACARALLATYSPNLSPPLTEALTDFVFNLGIGNYRTSTLCREANAGNLPHVKAQLLLWDHSGGQVIPGLLARREAEVALLDVA